MNIAGPVPPAPQQPGAPSAGRRRPVIAVIDLGSNNCRLLIAQPLRGARFRVIDSFSRVVRLGEGVAASGMLSQAAIERAVAALAVCAERLARHGEFRHGEAWAGEARPGEVRPREVRPREVRLRAIATEACRRAANADVLLARVKAETGIALTIISADEEARLAAIGCAPLLGEGFSGALVFDIGGGSTELIWLEAGEAEPVFATSVRAGVVAMAETFGRNASFAALRAGVMPMFADVAKAMAAKRAFDPHGRHLLGTSGTVTTLAALCLGLPRYDRDKVDGSWHDAAQVMGIVETLAGLDLAGRAALGCIGPERADLVLAGCAIYSAIQALWPCSRLRVADRGLREGMIRELMSRE